MDAPAPPNEGPCIESGFSPPYEGGCEVSASARGVREVLKASLRLHSVYFFWLAHPLNWLC